MDNTKNNTDILTTQLNKIVKDTIFIFIRNWYKARKLERKEMEGKNKQPIMKKIIQVL